MATNSLAPGSCIVCNKPMPEIDVDGTWTYIAGGEPLGSMACSKDCLRVALGRYSRTGRLDNTLTNDSVARTTNGRAL